MITIENLSIAFNNGNLFENANIKILPNDRLALVGANGTGKTTLLRIIAGLEEPDSGNVFKQKGISIGYLPQEFYDFATGRNIFDEVKYSVKEVIGIEEREKEISRKLNSVNLSNEEKNKLLEEFGNIQHEKETIEFYSIESKIKKILTGLGFRESDFEKKVNEFSGGWKMRIHLAKILIAEHNLILLDEPTNHLDFHSLRWLTDFLTSYKNALLIVSHDRYFIEKTCSKTIEITNGKINVFNGSFSKYLNYKEQKDRELREQKKNREKKVKEIEKFIERFRYKASKAKQVQSRIKMLEKLDEITTDEAEETINIKFKQPSRLPVNPVEVKNLNKSYGDLLVLENISFKIERGDKIAFIGINGAGKSTLSKIIAGKLKFESGNLSVHPKVNIGYFSQETADNLDLTKDVLDTLMEANSDYTIPQLRTILGAFLFSGDDVFKKVAVLSGGEKARLALAKLLLTNANFLILDEPTNHLDFSSKKVLMQALKSFEGNIILVSHDIEFMKPFVNKVFHFENKKINEFFGGIDYFLSKFDFNSSLKSMKNNNGKKLSSKDKKRYEAEIRQEKYKATKDLKIKIEKLENKIYELEDKIDFYSNELTKPEIYSNSDKTKEVQKKYKITKSELDKTINLWTELSDELENIEKKFQMKI